MGIFDIFSNSDAQNAAGAQTAAYNTGYGQLSNLFQQGQTDLSNNYGNAATNLQNYSGAGINALGTNYAAALQPLISQQQNNTAGQTQLADLLGLNGPNGSATAQTTLQNLPGYQFALNQGSQNVLRNANAAGTGISGGTLNALQQQGQGLASQNYNNYVSQLQPYLSASNTGASNIAGTYSNLGNQENANLTGTGQALSGINTGLGNQLNSNLMTQGNAAYGTQAAIGNAQAQADYTNLAQSQAALGALGGIGKAALGSGGLFGSQGLVSGLSSLATLSDERAKDDIEKVGELFDGTNVYRYRYKGSPRHEIGLIAQEVERDTPSAVVHDFAGTKLKGVDYRKATNWAAELGHLREAA
jgi:endosialidase-like protein